MLSINFLPWRNQQQQKKRKLSYILAWLALILSLSMLGMGYSYLKYVIFQAEKALQQKNLSSAKTPSIINPPARLNGEEKNSSLLDLLWRLYQVQSKTVCIQQLDFIQDRVDFIGYADNSTALINYLTTSGIGQLFAFFTVTDMHHLPNGWMQFHLLGHKQNREIPPDD